MRPTARALAARDRRLPAVIEHERRQREARCLCVRTAPPPPADDVLLMMAGGHAAELRQREVALWRTRTIRSTSKIVSSSTGNRSLLSA